MTIDVEYAWVARRLALRVADGRDDHLRRRLEALVGVHDMVEGAVLFTHGRKATTSAPLLSRSGGARRLSLRATCSAVNRRPVRLTRPSSASREATARRDSPRARSQRARAIVARSRRLATSSHAIRMQREAEGNRADTLAAGALGGERRGRARANQAVLVLRSAVDHGADERIGRRIAAAFAAGADEAGALHRHGVLDARREQDVARDPIALGHDEHRRLVLTHGAERPAQGGTMLERHDAAHALIDVPLRNADPLAGGPRLDGGTLSLWRESLLALGRAHICDGDAQVVHGRSLGHGRRR
jgi:hypothetical protein